MKKKQLKAKDKGFPERPFGVVLEDIDSKLDLVVEGQEVLDTKIDKVDRKVDDLHEEMNYKFEVVFDELRIIRNVAKVAIK